MTSYEKLWKRCFDLCVATIILIFTSPVILIVAILVRWKLGSPILFTQQRPGLHGKPFQIYKFRTMTDEVDSEGKQVPVEKRMTSLGTFLRRCSVDELPQLYNVFIGDVSIVGPRPLLMKYLSLYSPQQARRHEVKPGITGWAQVNGRNDLTWEEKFELDVWYVDHQSFLLDLKILWLTGKTVLSTQGVTPQGKMTVPNFSGSNHHKIDKNTYEE